MHLIDENSNLKIIPVMPPPPLNIALYMSVGMSVSLNLVQLITQDCFAQETSNLVGR